MPKIEHLIFDLDDTLISCAKYYAECKNAFADQASTRTGLPREFCKEILQKIDLECTNLPNGWGKERFPKSFAAASAALDIIAGHQLNAESAEQAFLLGETVFNASYDLLPDVEHTLEKLSKSYELYLLTKGDYALQLHKIEKHKLTRFFRADRIYIVPRKSAFEMQRVLIDNDVDPTTTVAIGDSLRDDIHSANRLNVLSVHINNGSGWGYETVKAHPTWTCKSIAEIPDILRHYSQLEWVTNFTNAFTQ